MRDEVWVLDRLTTQVLAAGPKRPSYQNGEAELMNGKIWDRDAARQAAERVTLASHHAAAGVHG
jgi:hypothetical protein